MFKVLSTESAHYRIDNLVGGELLLFKKLKKKTEEAAKKTAETGKKVGEKGVKVGKDVGKKGVKKAKKTLK